MHQRTFGNLGDISALTLGGGGTGQVWGPTTREEAIATVREAWEAGITFFDVAPSYGRGEAEVVLGEAFGGRLPEGVRVSTKCAVGNRAAREVLPLLERSLDESLARMKLERVDLFFLHNQIVPDETADQTPGTPRRLFVAAVRPAFEQLVARGRIGAWGITGIGSGLPRLHRRARAGEAACPAAHPSRRRLGPSAGHARHGHSRYTDSPWRGRWSASPALGFSWGG
jgi:aryl-alcohol dehydrogenase-like predicted oxidoreductase